jgi:uncharacterized repeat protein (TIGR02543 family)
MTVYAKWTVIQYTVTFNADGGSPETQTKTVNSGASIGEANMPEEPTTRGYTFDGWFTRQNGGGSQFTAETTVSADMTVYAGWTIIQYTVTFNADGGTPETQTKTVNSGSSIGEANMPSDPTRAMFGFDGWYTEENGEGSPFTATTPVSGSLTVYAKWILYGSVQISLKPAQDDSPLSNTSLSVNDPAEFSAGTGYASYQWYWNGKVIADEDSSTYTLAANSKTPGIYELSVLVTTSAGERFSARCRVTITAY